MTNNTADPYAKSAKRVTSIINRALPLMDRNVRTRTQLSSTDLAAAVYATLLPQLNGDLELTNAFIDSVITQNPTLYETLFYQFYNLGYAAAINDVVDKKLKVTR